MTDPEVLEISLHIAADPETVFPYFTDPDRYGQWMGALAFLDPVPGGQYRVWLRNGVEALGQFLEIDPPKRVVFTWGWTDEHAVAPGSTRVEITIAAEAGGSRVVLRHHDLPDGAAGQHRQGWNLYLNRLAVTAAGGDPGPDPNA